METELQRVKREKEALERKLKEAEKRREEEALFGFMSGRVGKKYGMWASGEF